MRKSWSSQDVTYNRLQFIIELEKNRTLNFLDLSLIVIDDTKIFD